MSKKLIIVLISICMLFAVMSVDGAKAAGEKEYTIMIILNGSDLESDGSAGTDDIKEMMQIGSDENINIIVQTGGTKKWHTKEIDEDTMQRWYIENGDIVEIEDAGNGNIGDAKVISDFATWGMKKYPAKKYALFFWNHGAGPIGGYGYDENYDDSLNYMENVQALKNIYAQTNTKFEIIGYDCCLMGTLEYASLISKYGNYFIGSEELEPGHGWDYTGLFRAVRDNPQITGDEWGRQIIDSFFAQAEDQRTDTESTLSLLDAANIDNLMGSFDAFVAALRKDIEDTDKVNNIIKARLQSESYGLSPYAEECTDTVDVWDLADNLSDMYPSEAGDLKAAIENTVVYSKCGRDKPNAKGVSIYWPAKNVMGYTENYTTIENIYDGYGVSSEYLLFLNSYSEFIKDGSGVEYAYDDDYDYDDGYDDYGYEDGLFSGLLSWLYGDDEYYDDDDYYDDDEYYDDEGIFSGLISFVFGDDDEYYDDNEYYDEDEYYDDDDDYYYEDDEYYEEDDSYGSDDDEGYWDGYYEMDIDGQTYEVELYVQVQNGEEYIDTIYVYADPDYYSVGYFDNNGEWIEEYTMDVEGDKASNRTRSNDDKTEEVAAPPSEKQEADSTLEETLAGFTSSEDMQQAKGQLEDSDKGITLHVDPQSLNIIDKVYLCVGKVLDNPSDRAIILGLDTDVEINEDGTIFGEVYEGWEMLNGEFISMYELEYDEETNMSKYGIPVKLNGVKHYIIVVYNDEFPDGEIIGARRINERGLPDKHLVQIKVNDEIIPYYQYEDENGDTGLVLGNKFIVEDKLELGWQEFPAGEYVFGFEILDIYQNRTYTDFIVYEYDENGIVKLDGPSIKWSRLLLLILALAMILFVIIMIVKRIKKKNK